MSHRCIFLCFKLPLRKSDIALQQMSAALCRVVWEIFLSDSHNICAFSFRNAGATWKKGSVTQSRCYVFNHPYCTEAFDVSVLRFFLTHHVPLCSQCPACSEETAGSWVQFALHRCTWFISEKLAYYSRKGESNLAKSGIWLYVYLSWFVCTNKLVFFHAHFLCNISNQIFEYKYFFLSCYLFSICLICCTFCCLMEYFDKYFEKCAYLLFFLFCHVCLVCTINMKQPAAC